MAHALAEKPHVFAVKHSTNTFLRSTVRLSKLSLSAGQNAMLRNYPNWSYVAVLGQSVW